MPLRQTTGHSDQSYSQRLVHVSVRFLHYETLVSLIPLVIVLVPAGMMLKSLLAHAPSILAFAWVWFIMGLLVGRFAIASAQGRFNNDFFEAFSYAELPSYTIRFLAASTVWGVPLYLVFDRFGSFDFHLRLDFNFWLVLTTVSALTFLPLFSTVLAAVTRSPLHMFVPSLWRHLLRKENNVWGIVVAQLGALVAAGLLYLPILGLLSLFAGKISPVLSQYIALFPIILPILSWPIIAGRLAGVWAYYHPLPLDLEIQKNDQPIELPGFLEESNDIPELSSEIIEADQMSGPKPSESLKFPIDKISNASQQMVIQSLDAQDFSNAYKAYRSMGRKRHELEWSIEQLELLGKICMENRDYRDAGWCQHTAELQRGQESRAEQKLLQVANNALAARELEHAVALYRYYIQKHPQGKFVENAHKHILGLSTSTTPQEKT